MASQPAVVAPRGRRLPEELMKRVRQIELSTKRIVNDVMSGQYKSHFKGQGVQFSEHRLYVAGDDVRHIDWKVSARSRDPVLKKFEEERELNVLLVVDVSGSEGFGSRQDLKSDVVAGLAGALAYAASHTGDKVGALFFAGEVTRMIPPRKGRSHVLRIVRDALEGLDVDAAPGTNLSGALESAGRLMKHGGVVFVISDFLAPDYERSLKRLARRHDVVALEVRDPYETLFPELGPVAVVDPETGIEAFIDPRSYAFKSWFAEHNQQHRAKTDSQVRSGRIEHLLVKTEEDYGDALVRFFRARRHRRQISR